MFNIMDYIIKKINVKELTREQKDEIYFIKKDIRKFLHMLGFDRKEVEEIMSKCIGKAVGICYGCIRFNNKIIDFFDNKNNLCFEILGELWGEMRNK